MILAIIIFFFAFGTAMVAVIAARDVITDKTKPGLNKLNRLGYVVIICAFFMSLLPLIQYFVQNSIDETKEKQQQADTAKHDRELRQEYQSSVAKQIKEYEASVSQIRKDFGDSNHTTLTVIGQTLGKYGYWLDTTEKRLHKFLKDSGNMKIILPDQPVLEVISIPPHPGIEYLKHEDGKYHYLINFVSEDGASCCYDIKISAVVLDTIDRPGDLHRLIYKSAIPVRLNQDDNLPKDGPKSWTFSIDDSDTYDVLCLWVRGTYYDRNGTHKYSIDQIYFNRKSSNGFGSLGLDTRKGVVPLVHDNEK